MTTRSYYSRQMTRSLATSVTMRTEISRLAQTVQSSSQCSPLISASYGTKFPMKPWLLKAWFDIVTKVNIMCHQVARAVRTARMLKYIEVRSPTLVSHVRALTDVEDLGGEVP